MISKIKQAVKKKLLPIVVSAMLVPSIAFAGESKLVKSLKKVEYGISAGIQHNFKNPAQDYINGVNQDFKDGRYTVAIPLPQWKDISVQNPQEYPIEFSVLYKTNLPKNIKVGLVGGISGSEIKNNYNEIYDVWNSVENTFVPYNFDRKENINIDSKSIGVKIKADLLKWLTASLTGKLNFYDIKGSINYAKDRLDDTSYTQWRETDYSGTDTINSLELGLDFNIAKNISLKTGMGYRKGKVKTKGTSVRTQSSNTEVTIYDYSPEFNLDSSYAKAMLEVRF